MFSIEYEWLFLKTFNLFTKAKLSYSPENTLKYIRILGHLALKLSDILMNFPDGFIQI